MRVLLLVAAIVVPMLASAQQARIGVLTFEQTPEPFKDAFRKGLREQGYVEGKNLVIEWRSADGTVERANQLAAELAGMKVNVIVASLTPAVTAARRATSTIPIGLTNTVLDVGSKLLGLFRELQPGVSRVAVLSDTRSSLAKPLVEEMESAGKKAGMHVVALPMKGPEDALEAFKTLQKERVQAIVVQPLLATKQLADLAREHRIMSITTGVASQSFPRLGGLLGYGSNPVEHYQRAAVYVAKILRGAKPGELPIEQPATFELIINMKTAKAIGLTVPKDMLVRANEVIE